MELGKQIFDPRDVTNGGTFQFKIGGLCFAELQSNAETCTSATQQVKKSQGNLYDTNISKRYTCKKFMKKTCYN